MFPDSIVFGLSLYEILMVVGFLSAVVLFRIFADREMIPARVQNLCIYGGLFGLLGGYGIAVLFQAFYNYLEDGTYALAKTTGATFYGGLLGGAGIFLAVYFIGGCFGSWHRATMRYFWRIADFAVCGIASAHAFGRIGCLCAGCCHGKVTDSAFGIYMKSVHAKVYPVQAYEALFLCLLTAWFVTRIFSRKSYILPLYMATYAVWRFGIEYLRGDDRGYSLIPGLSPSQMTAILLLVGAVVVYIFERRFYRRHPELPMPVMRPKTEDKKSAQVAE